MIESRLKHHLEDRRFGHLVVICRADPSPGVLPFSRWLCRCDCGRTNIVRQANLLIGRARSCGCRRNESIRRAMTKHGYSGSLIYKTWGGIKKRCLNERDHSFPRYGGRGITVCERWMKFENFLADMGERPAGTSIDRIDNNGNYEPGNCRWATSAEQANNRSIKRAANGRYESARQFSPRVYRFEPDVIRNWQPPERGEQ